MDFALSESRRPAPAPRAATEAANVSHRQAIRHAIERAGLPDAAFTWSDYYASADPVSNGPLAPGAIDHQRQPMGSKAPGLPSPCSQVYNSGSVAFDHNGYLRNQDELLPSLLNDLVAAAYGEPASTARGPELVRQSDVSASSQRRRRLLRKLVVARIAAIALFAALAWLDPGRALRHSIGSFMHRFAVPAGMSSDSVVRVLIAALVTATLYFTVVLAWQAAVRRSVRIFFRGADCPIIATQPEPDGSANQATMSGLSSSLG